MKSVADEGASGTLLSYMEATRPVQDLLKRVLTQVAGCSLMIMTRITPVVVPEGAMQLARVSAEQAEERLRALKVPAEAAHHFHHLLKVSEAVRWAFLSMDVCAVPGAGDADRDALTRALNAATKHLRVTARLLPGFEAVDLGLACCAMHEEVAMVGHAEAR